ncbi:hypothetical protein GZL_05794 [Streptomyces sp. 769]|nr:hypothetical protein GZL_05794 [Streptomyces sp. 769]
MLLLSVLGHDRQCTGARVAASNRFRPRGHGCRRRRTGCRQRINITPTPGRRAQHSGVTAVTRGSAP